MSAPRETRHQAPSGKWHAVHLTWIAVAAAPLTAQQRDTVPLSPIVISATRLPTPVASVPNDVTVLDGEALRAQGVVSLLDALRSVPGITVAQTGGYGGTASLFLRGGESDYVRVLVDGLPVNQPGGALNLADLRTDDVERIEIVRGASSVLYGSDAVSGVIQVVTRRGAGRPGGTVTLRAGTAGVRVVEVAVGAGGARGGVALEASRFSGDGMYRFNSGYGNTAVGLSLHAAPDARSDVRLTARHRDGTYRFPTDGAGVPADSNQFLAGRATQVAVDAGRALSPRVAIRTLVTWNRMRDRFDDRSDSPGDTLDYYGFVSDAIVTRQDADLRANIATGRGVTLTGGVVFEHQSETGSSVSLSQFGADSGTTDVSRSSRAAYAQLVVEDAGPLSLVAGVRADDNDAFGRFTTARAGVVVRLPRGARLRASTGTAFKEPTFIENFSTGFAVGNPALRPERSAAWEAGADWPLAAGRLVVGVTWFDQRFRDLIQYTFTAAPGDPNFVNVADAKASGLETSLRLQPGPGWIGRVSWSWTRTVALDSGFDGATFATGRPLLRRPAHAATAHLTRVFGARGTADLAVQVTGRRDDLDFAGYPAVRVTLPRYTRLDASASWMVTTRLTATVRADNLLDARYAEVLRFPALRRTVWAGLRAQVGG